MKLQDLLNAMEGTQTPKTAATTQTKTASAVDPLETALKQTLAETTKQAAASQSGSAVTALMQYAEKLAEADKQGELEMSKLMGVAFADAMVAKLAAYDAQIAVEAQKEAQRAYQKTAAAAEYNQGAEQALHEIKVAAANEYIKGAEEVKILMSYAQRNQK